jgi:hypothetical protein
MVKIESEIVRLLSGRLSIINIGIDKLVEHLLNFEVEVIQVDWKPPQEDKLDLLRKLRGLKE